MSDEEQGKDGKKLPAAFIKKMKKKGRKQKPKVRLKSLISICDNTFFNKRHNNRLLCVPKIPVYIAKESTM
jgi:hypothetical protein